MNSFHPTVTMIQEQLSVTFLIRTTTLGSSEINYFVSVLLNYLTKLARWGGQIV